MLLFSVFVRGAVALLPPRPGGINSGIGIVALLPVFWTALHGDRRQLCLVVAAVALFFFTPLVFIGGAEYPSSQYRAGVLFVAVSAIVGFTTQWLVCEVRFQASQAERREHDGRHLLAQMSDMASTDALTGLPNRRAWEARLREALLSGEAVMLAMLDLDCFKDYNDTHGHPAGDRLLRETAAAWRDELRVMDFLARVGGEVFALLLPATSSEDASAVVERLRARVPYGQTCSAGIVARKAEEDDESLMTRADEALYASKAGGRDRVTIGA
jgi:diguanylate cyclase (GGDEF)-like protein